MEKSRIMREGRRSLALAACLFAGGGTEAFAARIDPQEIEQLRGTVGMLLDDVEEFYHVTILIESFLIFMLLALIVVGIFGYSKLKKELCELRRRVDGEEEPEPEPEEEIFPVDPEPEPEPEPMPEPEPEPEPERKLSPLERFLEAYSEVDELQDEALRKERFASLLQEFSVEMFTCTNVEARRANPNTPPTFETKAEGDFWAIKKEGGSDDYHVIPNPTLAYDDDRHRFYGMKEAFASNYQEGKTYTHMRLDAPARFSLMGKLWAPVRPGKITLSEESDA